MSTTRVLKLHRAAKPWTCCLCGGEIARGAEYLAESTVRWAEPSGRPYGAEVRRRHIDCPPPSVQEVARVILNHSGSLGVHYMDVATVCAEAVLGLFKSRTNTAAAKPAQEG